MPKKNALKTALKNARVTHLASKARLTDAEWEQVKKAIAKKGRKVK